jgi:hypothetical protein
MFAQTAQDRKIVSVRTPVPPADRDPDRVTIRRSGPGDGDAISRLARLENRRAAAGPYVLAESGDEVIAAVPLCGGASLADPFMRTAGIVAMLEVRARQIGTPPEAA